VNSKIAIVDYGLGNLHSVQKAFRHLGHEATVVSHPEQLAGFDRFVLPGVGAFADGMKGLDESGLGNALRQHATQGRPILGICLGAQLLLQESEEFGRHAGLGLIAGRVVKLPCATAPVPHVGWARLKGWHSSDRLTGVLRDTVPGSWMYFIHSFHMVPTDDSELLAVCEYGGCTINAAVQQGVIAGVQFHPEKSGREGMKILSAFAS
jgi:glutamine amidotransferase